MADLPNIAAPVITPSPAPTVERGKPDADKREVDRSEKLLNERIQDQMIQDQQKGQMYRVTGERIHQYRAMLREKTTLSDRQVAQLLNDFFQTGNGSVLPGRDDSAVKTALRALTPPDETQAPNPQVRAQDAPPATARKGESAPTDQFIRNASQPAQNSSAQPPRTPSGATPPPPAATPPPPPLPAAAAPLVPSGATPPPLPSSNQLMPPGAAPGAEPTLPPGTPQTPSTGANTPTPEGTPRQPQPSETPLPTGTVRMYCLGDPPRPGTGHPQEAQEAFHTAGAEYRQLTASPSKSIGQPATLVQAAGTFTVGGLYRDRGRSLSGKDREKGGEGGRVEGGLGRAFNLGLARQRRDMPV